MSELIIKCRGGKRKTLPSVEFLRECLNYEPETGRLIWLIRPKGHFISEKGFRTWNSRFAGKEAGNKNFRKNGKKRYIEIGLASRKESGNRTVSATHIICALMDVAIHDGMEVDHKDRDVWNNKWDNLRVSTPQQNCCNRKAVERRHDLPRGVFSNGSGFGAKIMFNRINRHLGTFKTPQEAHEAYQRVAKELHGEFSCSA